ncbi:sec-independent protein translocase protein TATC, chloroplastic-like isoform X2 [Triticum urartu]|uniref:sec-independent protein translocase protein TATC, chloroplastic-like isoform X2 n=1 Tax=Triticum urartu TaxID=4572 RepID=UPI002044A570|nr:sec-independent protein translocase protein TATC, chloroplastic-like isoform X2 [Triticum urartu]
MGSAGALLSHPPPQVGSILLRRHHISLPHLSSCMPEPLHCRRRHLRCSAVEGSSRQDTNLPASQREESPSSSLGATLQDPLPGRGVTQEEDQSSLYNFLYPSKELLPDDKEMSIFDHLEELRARIFISVLAVGASIIGCFAFSKDIIKILEAPVSVQGVRFLQLSPGEFFFTTLKVNCCALSILLILFL